MVSALTRRLLDLSSLPGLGVGGLRRLVMEAEARGTTMLDDEGRVLQVHTRSGSASAKQNRDAWKTVLDRCASLDIKVLSPFDADYPERLRQIDDFPPLIYVLGDPESLKLAGCAVVGTRDASHLGLSWARQISEIVCGKGLSVVSGLALGIDTAAHEGALRVRGKTIAVLAHGLDKVTPARNRDLAERILGEGGCLLSEHAPGVPPVRQEYVRRNRIQSGTSICSIVVESAEEGGAIHQGNFTTRQGRPLFCVVPGTEVPGSEDFKYGGARRLQLEAKARPITNRDDLDNAIADSLARAARAATLPPAGPLL